MKDVYKRQSLTKSLTQLPRSVRCYGNGKANFKMEQYDSILQQCGMFNGIQPRKYRDVYKRQVDDVGLGKDRTPTGKAGDTLCLLDQ